VTGPSVAETGSLSKKSEGTRIAVLCKHNLSSLEPGDNIHTYDKIVALARQASVVLFTPFGYTSRSMKSQMEIVEVSPAGLRFRLALVLALLSHRNDYDCIYTRDPMLMLFATPMKIFGKPLILEMNGIPSREAELRRRTQEVRAPGLTLFLCTMMRLIESFGIHCSDLVLPVTEKMRMTLVREYGAEARKVVMIPNSVDTTIFRPLENVRTEMRHKLGIRKETVVLYLSTFSTRWREAWQLFQVAMNIERKRNDIVFLVVGSGPLLEEMKATKARVGSTSRAIFAGVVDHHLVPIYMNAADVYVYDVTQVSSLEIDKQGLCPTKVLEAMACGMPVIVPKEPELQAMLRKSNGGFSASSLEEVEFFIESFADSADLARSTGMNARRYVELNHDLTCLTGLTVELIGEVVSSRKS